MMHSSIILALYSVCSKAWCVSTQNSVSLLSLQADASQRCVPEEMPQTKGYILSCTKEFHLCRLSPSLVLQVCTPWQGAMAMIASFPHAPQALTRMVDALAEEAGEPCAASIQLAVRQFSIADGASCNMNSVQNSIYRNKLHGQPRRPIVV